MPTSDTKNIMKLSLFTDNALKVLMYVASHPQQRCTRNNISKYFTQSDEHLRKVIHQLSQWGYLNTFAGRNGGVELAKPLNEINIGKLIRQTENQITLFDCKTNGCRLLASCSLNHALQKAQQVFFAELEKVTLDNLLENKKTYHLLNLE